jgi:hypothetical protein
MNVPFLRVSNKTMERFPVEFGMDLAGKTFEDIFEHFPKWVACVELTWTDNCTGLFKRFREFILLRLQDPISRIEHDNRCQEFVKTLKRDTVPQYLLKYLALSESRVYL